jgi:hypothetical protein
VQNCRVQLNMTPGGMAVEGNPIVANVEVRFINNAPQAATAVFIRLKVNGAAQTVVDRGKFSPGTPIATTFSEFAGRDYWRPEPELCEIVQVNFADGTIWRPTPAGARTGPTLR